MRGVGKPCLTIKDSTPISLILGLVDSGDDCSQGIGIGDLELRISYSKMEEVAFLDKDF